MKAIRIQQHGGPEVLSWQNHELPSPTGNQVLVKIAAAGINYIDVYQRTGHYPTELPYGLGLEGAGTVEAVGPSVSEFSPGDRVAYTSVPGSYAEYVLAPAEKLVHVPDGIDLRTAAACMLQGMTAQYLTHTTYKLKPGDTCLVHAAAGGVGLLLVQMAKATGARVIGTVSSQEKMALAKKAGVDHLINSREQDFEAEVQSLTNTQGLQVIYDGIGKDTFLKGINCLAPLGMMVLYGQASGPVAPFDPALLSKSSLFLTRPVLFHYVAARKDLLSHANAVFDLIAKGRLQIHISEVFKMSDAALAHQSLESRKTTGKLLLVP